MNLMDFIPTCALPTGLPARPPYHLHDFVEVLDQAPRGSVRALCSVPIRHHKTTTVICAIIKWLKEDPTLNIVYMTHGLDRAKQVAKDIRDMARNMGISAVKGHDEIVNWRTERGGGVQAFSADQSRLGANIDILIVDDPYEGPVQADDPRIRKLVIDVIDFYENRLMAKGSCIIVMSRFHPEDVIGVKRDRAAVKWQYFHGQAIMPDGKAFCSEVYTIEELLQKKAEIFESDPYGRIWWSQWQNEPIAPNADGFDDPARYTILPDFPGFIDGIGLDMSFTNTKRSDFSALVSVRKYPTALYVKEIVRIKADPATVEAALSTMRAMNGNCGVYSYMAGPEKSLIEYFWTRGVHVHARHASAPKFVRAQPTINSWRAKKILLPMHAPWVNGALTRFKRFRGVEDDPDDEVDALVSVHDGMASTPATFGRALGQRRM